MPTFPATLPAPLVNGFAYIPTDAVVRTQMDSGPARQRRRFTQFPTVFQATWRLTQAQLLAFEQFHHTSLSDGQAWFTLSLYTGAGITASTVRFTKPYQVKLVSNLITDVVCELEAQSRPYA